MQACKLSSCFCYSASNNRLVSLLWWNAILRLIEVSVSQWCGGTRSFTICGNSVVYQSAPLVDLCRRLFPVDNAVLLPVEGPFVEHPLASPWNRFHTNRLTQTITQFGSVFCNCFQCLLRTLTDVEWWFFFTQIIQITTQATFDFFSAISSSLVDASWRHTPIRTLIGWLRRHSNN